MTLGTRLKQKRKENKLTQVQVAETLGVDNSTVSKWESDTYEPDAENLKKLSKLYNTSTDELLGRTDDPAPAEKEDPLAGISRAFHDYDSLPEDEKEYLREELPEMVKWKLEEFRRMKAKFMEQRKKEQK